MGNLCPFCADWAVASEHVFCGGCGAFLRDVELELTERSTSTGTMPCIRIESDRQDLKKIPFAILEAVGGENREIARVLAGEHPEGTLLTLAQGQDHGLRIRAVAAYGKEGPAPNNLAEAVVHRSTGESHLSLRLAEASLDFAGARRTVPGWSSIDVELFNSGPPVLLSNARIRVDGEPSGEEDPEPTSAVPILLASGQTGIFAAWISDAEIQALFASSRPRAGTIDIEASKADGGTGRVAVTGRARLFQARGPSMKAELAWRVRGRAGHPARVGARVTNTGGSRLHIETVDFVIGETVLLPPMPLEWRQPLDPGEEALAELRPVFPEPARHDNAVLRITARAENDERPLIGEARRSAEVTPADAVFKGWICIDFGTSESGAAALPQGAHRPFVIELARVPLQQQPEAQDDRDRWGRFLPTVVAEMANGSFRAGADASALVQAHQLAEEGHPWPDGLERPKRMAAEFKWQLDDDQQDSGARGQLLATAYLETVKELIENHPEIAASLGDGTRVVATRPTVFDSGRAERLVRAFVDAGLGDPRVTLPSGEASLIAESWAPLPFVLQDANLSPEEYARAMLPLDRDIVLNPIPDPDDPKRAGASAWLLVCDVGAGSADFSMVEIAPEAGGGRQLLRERDSHTDLDFVGRRFRALICDVLEEWAGQRWVAAGNSLPDPQRFAVAIGARADSAPEAYAAFQQAVRALQFDPGILSGGGFPFALQSALESQAGSGVDIVETLVAREFAPGGAARKAARAHLPLELAAPDGSSIVIDPDNVGSLVTRLTHRFLVAYRDRLQAVIDALIERSGLAAYLNARDADKGALLVRIVPSGRGAAFAPAKALIRAAVASLSRKSASLGVLTPVASKSITSWGGLQLGAALENELADFHIDVGGRPLRPRVVLGMNINRTPRLLELNTVDGGAFVDLATVAQRHVAIRDASTLRVFAGPEADAVELQVELPPEAAAAPEGWWLCGMRQGARIRIEIVAAESGEAALGALRAKESVAHD